MQSKIKFTIKTPQKNTTSYNKKDAIKLLKDTVNENVAKVAINNLILSTTSSYDININILATFFQRVCARTPIDETYTYTYKGKEHTHKANKIQCRMHWYIKDKGKRVSSWMMRRDLGKNIFDKVNDKQSIKKIANYLKSIFPSFTEKVIIGNDVDDVMGSGKGYFNKLEYGGYKQYIPPRKGTGDVMHGVRNEHSVQAPVGMLRITMMELEYIKDSCMKEFSLKKYKNKVVPIKQRNNRKLKDLVSFFASNNKFNLNDIRRYIGV